MFSFREARPQGNDSSTMTLGKSLIWIKLIWDSAFLGRYRFGQYLSPLLIFSVPIAQTTTIISSSPFFFFFILFFLSFFFFHSKTFATVYHWAVTDYYSLYFGCRRRVELERSPGLFGNSFFLNTLFLSFFFNIYYYASNFFHIFFLYKIIFRRELQTLNYSRIRTFHVFYFYYLIGLSKNFKSRKPPIITHQYVFSDGFKVGCKSKVWSDQVF